MIANQEKDVDYKHSYRIQQYLKAAGKSCLTRMEGPIPADTQCILVLGGDGTLIHTAVDYVDYDIPFLGINLGTLGFLTDLEENEVYAGLDRLMEDQYKVESRMMLQGTVFKDGQRKNQKLALNDIIVTRSGYSRVVETRVYVNDIMTTEYAGDGVIVSTPTGSTGYNLSAGGPIVLPETELMVITPICPHSLTSRSLVVSSEDRIRIELGQRRKTQTDESQVSYDGQTDVNLVLGDSLEIRRAQKHVHLIKVTSRTFYQVLMEKV